MKLKMFCVLLLVYLTTSEGINLDNLDNVFGDKECIEGKLIFGGSSILVKMDSNNNGEAGKITGIMTTQEKEEEEGAVKTKDNILININAAVEEDKNPLLLLNKLAQINKLKVKYLIVDEEGPQHDKTFNLRLDIGDETYFAAEKSIKEAKMALARKALSETKYPLPEKKSVKKAATVDALTPTVLLNNIASKLGMKVEYINEMNAQIHEHEELSKSNFVYLDSSSKSYVQKLNSSLKNTGVNYKTSVIPLEKTQKGPFKVRVNVGEETFFGTDVTIQGARHKAAQNALEHFNKMSAKDAAECLDRGEICNKLSIKSPISLVYEMASKAALPVQFEIIEESGATHKKNFVTLCKVGDSVARGEGKSKKESKKRASENMLRELHSKGLSPGNSINVSVKKEKSKKKKNKSKISRGAIDNLKVNLLDAFSSIGTVFDGTTNNEVNQDDQLGNKKPNKKRELLELGETAGFKVEFHVQKFEDTFTTLISLSQNGQHYICKNSHIDRDISEERATNAVMNLLQNSGFKKLIVNQEEKSEQPINFEFDEQPEVQLYKM